MRRMGLRARLAAFFVVITVLPSVLLVLAQQSQIDASLAERADLDLTALRGSTVALAAVQRDRAGDLATDLVVRGAGERLRGTPEEAQAWLTEQVGDAVGARADAVVLADAAGTPVASATAPAAFSESIVPPSPLDLARATVDGVPPPGALVEVRRVESALPDGSTIPVGAVVTAVWMDAPFLLSLQPGDGAALVQDGTVLAAVGASAPQVPTAQLPTDGVTAARLGSEPVRLTAAALGDGGASLVVWARAGGGGGPTRFSLSVLAISVLVAALLGMVLASSVVAPVRRAADVARAVAAGDLRQELPARGGRELADLAIALNTMSAELAARLAELSRSRDELRRSLARLGQTLSSSLDLERTLAVVVETAMDTLGAERAALYLLTPERDALYVKVGRSIGERPVRVALGEGIVGAVAADGRPIVLPSVDGSVPRPVTGEPSAAAEIAIPLRGRGRIIGVLALLRDDAARPFSGDDVDTIRSFASQASVAMENVLLHQEAQRLSVTDALTGLWNFRYFQQQAERELESAGRFARAVSLVILDIDHFKQVNDVHGHQVGDEVLVEVARRIRDSTRVPDVVARYGGEEFVVLLPGTDAKGGVVSAERIRAAVGEEPVPIRSTGGEDSLSVTISAGVATFPRNGKTVAGLLRNADAAMYTAKSRGRNRVIAAGSAGVAALGKRAKR